MADPITVTQNTVSDTESEMVKLLRRGRVGSARIRRHKDVYWEIDCAFPGGKRQGRHRKYRRSATAAYQTAMQMTRDMKKHGQLALALTSGQRWEASDCYRLLAPLGASLREVVAEFVERHPKAGMARTMDQVRIELVAKKVRGERRQQYVSDFDYKVRCLIKALGNVPIASVRQPMLEAELARHNWASGTVHSTVTSWKVLFNYARKQGYITESPCNNLEMPRLRRAKPEILTVEQVRTLLAACRTHPEMEQCTAYVAIGCFTGIRPQEMQRMTWEMINLDAGLITIEGEDAKCGERGIVKMSANLVSWLRPIASTGPVLAAPIDQLRVLCREWLRRTWPKLTRWPHDCMRHSFGSYHYTQHRDIGEVCTQMRHGTGALVFVNHYYVVVTPAEARAFWAIVRPVALLTA